MTTYSTIITNNGKAMFASAATSSGRVNITHLAVGDGNGSVPTPKAIQTRLIKEAHRVTVNSVERHATNANWIEIGAIIPSSSGGYTVREIGLYAGNTLIAVGSFPATYKPTASEGGAREMSIRIIIAVENAAVVNVTLDNSLVYATRQWVESNFVNHNEVIDNLTSIDADKPLSANQGKVLKDGLDGLTTSKADKTTNLTAGNGLTGGGNLSASRTVALGTPSQITAGTTNSVTTTSHTHAIDKASTTVAGVVQLNDTLASTATDQALTAAQGKVLKDGLDGLTTSKADKTTNLTAGNGLTGGGNLSASRTVALGTPGQITATSTNGVTTTSHTHAIDKASTTVAGVVQLNDTLTSTATNQALTAAQGKVLKDGLDGLTTSKADKTTNLTAGNGLTGGGNLSASRTVALGTPSQITAGTTNSVTTTSHTHAIDKASTTVAGVVQLVDNLTTDDATKALTARQGKVLNDKIDNKDSLKTIDYRSDKSSNYELTGFYRSNAIMMGSNPLPAMEMHITHPAFSGNSYARGIGFTYGGSFDLTTTAWDAQGVYLGQKTILTELNGVMLSDKSNSIELDDAGKVATSKAVYTLNQAKLDKTANAVSASKLQTARTINGVAFDGTQNIVITDNTKAPAVHRHNWSEIDDKPAIITNPTHITSGDLDNYKETGVYYCKANVHAQDIANTPSDRAFALEVVRAAGVVQIFREYETAIVYMRAFYNRWSPWKRLATTEDNAPTATKLQTARTINGVAFDGTQNITIYDNTKLASNANAVSASRLATARTISLTGAVTGSVSFNGSANVSIATTLQQGLGVGQSWRDVSASRSSSVTYTNSTGRPIFVRAFVTGGNKNLIGYVNGMIVDRHRDTYNSGVPEISIGFIVPNGATYRIDYTHADTVILELR